MEINNERFLEFASQDDDFIKKALKDGHIREVNGKYEFSEVGEAFKQGIMRTLDFAVGRPEQFKRIVEVHAIMVGLTKGSELEKKLDEFLEELR